MKSLTTTALVAIVAGTLGFAALTPAAFAQQAPNPGQPGQPGQPGMQMPHHQMQMQGQMPGNFGQHGNGRMRNARGPGNGGGLLALVCSDQGAERAEIGFVRLAYRLELTAEQQTLFDDLKASALTAQTQFAEQCAQPAAPAADGAQPAMPNPVERLTAQIGNDTLRLDLMQDLLPKLEAFYDSLTDAQKASLQPQRGGDGRGFRRHGELPAQPGQPADPAAPAEAAPAAFLIG